MSIIKYLHFVNFSSIESWSTYSLLGKNLVYTQKYKLNKIGSFLKRNKTQVTIQNDVKYKRPTIRINGQGIKLRDEVYGRLIGTKNQFRIKSGQFLLSKIDARNGAFGVVNQEVDNAVITGNFWTFDVNYNIINPHYLTLLTGTKEFQKLCQAASVGTTNRNYLQEGLFLNFEIPLPTIPEQKRIVDEYTTKIEQALSLKNEADNIEQEIDKFFSKELGLPQFEIKIKTKGLLTINFEDLDRWDFFSTDIRVAQMLKKTKFPVKSIGMTYKIAKRSWNKKNAQTKIFKYIEIGAIDSFLGILQAKELPVNKAPSRATQVVKSGDLIIGTTRPYLKKFAIVTDEYNNDICSSGFIVLEPSSDYYLPFLMQFLKSTYGIEQLKNRMTGGLYPAITESEFKEVKIPAPDISIQIAIMKKVKEKEMTILANKSLIVKTLNEAIQEFEKTIFN